MKPVTKRRFTFIGKSMLWSVLLYIVLMLAFNWDEVSNNVTGRNTITVVTRSLPDTQIPVAGTPAATIAAHSGVLHTVIAVLQSLTGMAR